jgi:hypothetical protein
LAILFSAGMAKDAQAQSCNAEGTACIDTAGLLMPAQVIEFRVEAGATLVSASFAQEAPGFAHGGIRGVTLLQAGPPGGHDVYQAVLPGEGDAVRLFGGSYFPARPFGDVPTNIRLVFRSPSTPYTGDLTSHHADYDTVAPTVNRAASIEAGTTGQLAGRFTFEARREVRVVVTLVLSGKRRHSGKGWREFATASADEIVGTGSQAIQTDPLARKCPRRFDRCKAKVQGQIRTYAAGEWWPSGDVGARLKPVR